VLSKNLPRYVFLLFGSGGVLDQDCAAGALLRGKSIYGDLSIVCDTAKQRNRPELANLQPPVTTLLLLPFVADGISSQ